MGGDIKKLFTQTGAGVACPEANLDGSGRLKCDDPDIEANGVLSIAADVDLNPATGVRFPLAPLSRLKQMNFAGFEFASLLG